MLNDEYLSKVKTCRDLITLTINMHKIEAHIGVSTMIGMALTELCQRAEREDVVKIIVSAIDKVYEQIKESEKDAKET